MRYTRRVMSAPEGAPYVWANGAIVPGDRPVISAEDQGFLLGLSVFDTVLYEDGCLYFVEDHLARLRGGAAELGIAWPPPWDPARALWQTAEAVGERSITLRMTLTRGVPGRGPTMTVTPRPVEVLPPQGVNVHVSSHKKLYGNQLERLKSTNRLRNVLAREEAQAHGAWEAVFQNDEGDLTEGTISNLFLVVDGGRALATASTERGCLGGITRERLLDDLAREPLAGPDGDVEVRIGRVEVEDLRAADEVFLTNTSGRVIPVLAVSGLEPGVTGLPGADGPLTKRLRARFAAIERRYREAGRAAARAPGRA